MAFVLALIITGWLIAFTLGAQAGFNNEPEATQATSMATSSTKAQAATSKKGLSRA